MAKLSAMREGLNNEEKELYEKYKREGNKRDEPSENTTKGGDHRHQGGSKQANRSQSQDKGELINL